MDEDAFGHALGENVVEQDAGRTSRDESWYISPYRLLATISGDLPRTARRRAACCRARWRSARSVPRGRAPSPRAKPRIAANGGTERIGARQKSRAGKREKRPDADLKRPGAPGREHRALRTRDIDHQRIILERMDRDQPRPRRRTSRGRKAPPPAATLPYQGESARIAPRVARGSPGKLTSSVPSRRKQHVLVLAARRWRNRSNGICPGSCRHG